MSVYVYVGMRMGYVHVHVGLYTLCVPVHVCTNNMYQCIWRQGINNRCLLGPLSTLYVEAGSLKDGLVMTGGVQWANHNLVVSVLVCLTIKTKYPKLSNLHITKTLFPQFWRLEGSWL